MAKDYSQLRALAVFIALTALPSPVLAAEAYLTLEAGTFAPGNTSTINSQFVPVTVEYSPGWAVGGAIGLQHGAVRTETEVVYREASPDAWGIGILANLWIDGRNSTPLTPYFGGGLGFARGHAASPGPIDNIITGVAYQVGGGLGWSVFQMELDLGYRYFGISGTSEGGPGSKTLAGSSFLAGTRFKF